MSRTVQQLFDIEVFLLTYTCYRCVIQFLYISGLEKRREEAKRKKEELRELELRNVALKTEASGLTTEICYLKGLLHEVLRR